KLHPLVMLNISDHLTKALMDINESPVYVLLNPTINHAQKKMLNSRIRVLHQYLGSMQK
uniref:COP9 signalosome complex subunit 6b (Fragments) n=1 Tax=Brassica oleracea TaxID=3712 RepID=CSN6B_BRAOL|nr:RecName: Full=COP9 signalosome complex subunit 6b; Short=Signalosome subunit 6b [Brassica oleracea]